MIKGHVSDLSNPKVHPVVTAVLAELQKLKKEDFPLEQRKLDDDGMYINFASCDTAPAEERKSEAHVAYVDLHYIVAGTERIDVGNVSDMTISKAYDEKDDFAFYEGEHHSSCILKEGDFMVCFPEDVHRVLVATTTPAPIYKAIAKIPLNRF